MNAQEQAWAGDFGRDYIARNSDRSLIGGRVSMFATILARTRGINSVIEFGANIGHNLVALRELLPTAELSAVEPNREACAQLLAAGFRSVHSNMEHVNLSRQWDMALTRGVLIHIPPDQLANAYDTLYHASSRYICIAEYYSPTPVMIPYRGKTDLLWKRDFAGELMDRFEGLRLVDYGFVYRRDPNWPQDDVTWFLMEKR